MVYYITLSPEEPSEDTQESFISSEDPTEDMQQSQISRLELRCLEDDP